ncbi:MAG: type IV pilus assembly protein PilM [Tepidisphaeraceae bacterium]|jgi:type IV pilus assembly protein PilM
MATARFAWGIDVGNRALKAIKLVRGDSGLRIDDFEVIEHENVLSNAGDNKEALIQAALANFVQRHPSKGGVAAISVSGVSSFARFIKLPPVEPKKIPDIVRFEAIQQIPFPLDDVEWSYQLFQSPDSPEVEVGIFAMRHELVNQHIKHFTDVNLNVQVVQMNPLAVYNAMYYDGRIKGTTMIIDLGAENSDLIIAEGESIWLRSIPIGGNNFTDVLVKSFKLPFGKAEELKRNANTSKYARQIFQAMRPVFADLVAEIQRSIGFYSSVHRDSRIAKVLALGGTFRLAGLQKYLQQNLQLEVEKLHEITAGAPTDVKLASNFNQNLPSLISAYGLAIQAMGEGKITSNLLPRRIRREQLWRDKTKWFSAAAAAFVLGTGLAAGGYYLQSVEYQQAQDVRQNCDTLNAKGKELDASWRSQVEGAGSADRQKITNVRAMLSGHQLWPGILCDILSALPKPPEDMRKLLAVPRQERNVILIDRCVSQYSDDLLRSIASGQLGPDIAAPLPNDPALPAGCRGFIVTINLTTPHKDGFLFVLLGPTSYISNLQKMNHAWMDQYNSQNPATRKNYYIAKAFTPTGQKQLINDPERLQAMDTSYAALMGLANVQQASTGGGEGEEGGGETPSFNPAPGAAAEAIRYQDRLTGEDRRSDWEMKVVLIVVIDPGSKPSAPGQ